MLLSSFIVLYFQRASGTGAIIAAWAGLFFAMIAWLVAAKALDGEVNVDTLGSNEAMLSGNIVAIVSSAFIHYVYSKFIDPQDYDFAELDQHITLVEQDTRGLTDDEKDPVLLRRTERWIKNRGYWLTLILIVIWPLLSVPAGEFSRSYFAFWVLVAIAWGFGAATIITVLPLSESADDIAMVLSGISNRILGREQHISRPAADATSVKKEVEDSKLTFAEPGHDPDVKENSGTDSPVEGEDVEA
jgi:Na+/proline symporter